MKTYNELITLDSYLERLKYLRLFSRNPANADRALMNRFYKSNLWLEVRDRVIHRDLGCDLGVENMFINNGHILVHHIEPITVQDLIDESSKLWDMNNLITVSYDTHNKIHYKNEKEDPFVERRPGDTKLW